MRLIFAELQAQLRARIDERRGCARQRSQGVPLSIQHTKVLRSSDDSMSMQWHPQGSGEAGAEEGFVELATGRTLFPHTRPYAHADARESPHTVVRCGRRLVCQLHQV